MGFSPPLPLERKGSSQTRKTDPATPSTFLNCSPAIHFPITESPHGILCHFPTVPINKGVGGSLTLSQDSQGFCTTQALQVHGWIPTEPTPHSWCVYTSFRYHAHLIPLAYPHPHTEFPHGNISVCYTRSVPVPSPVTEASSQTMKTRNLQPVRSGFILYEIFLCHLRAVTLFGPRVLLQCDTSAHPERQ